ncbi:MAG: type IV pilus assembly protein PilM [Candidatus Nanopelagicales bacterium]
MKNTAAPRLVGLDLGSTGIRAVEAKHGRDGWRIMKTAEIDLPPGAIHGGVIADPASVSKALRRLWRAGRFSTRKVAAALSDAGVITRQIDLPWMPPDDFRSALKYQVVDSLPVDLSTVELDYQPLAEFSVPDGHGHSTDMLQVLLVATPSEAVADLCETLISARLEPVRADTTAFALIRTASGGSLPVSDECTALVDIGADVLTVVIHQGGRPLFIRSIPGQGGELASLTVSAAMGMDIEDARALVIATGLNGPPPVITPVAESNVFGLLSGTGEVPIDLTTSRAMALINPWATTLVSAIRDSLDYFNAAGGTHVSRLVLTGRTAQLNGLSERITTELRIPVTLLDPFAGLDRAKRVSHLDSRSYAVATGLAMGA